MNAGAKGYIWAIVYEKPARYDVTDRGPCRIVAPPFVFVPLFVQLRRMTAPQKRCRGKHGDGVTYFAPRGGLVMALPDSLP
jgi:hypothetical protein